MEFSKPRKRQQYVESKGRKRLKKSDFLEIEAEQYDSEESDIDSDFADEAKQFKSTYQFQPRQKSKLETAEPEEIARQFEQRTYQQYQEYSQEKIGHLQNYQKLPSLEDPKLFLVRCQKGKERQAVFNLLEKFKHCKENGIPMYIFTVFSSDFVKDCIYIESYKQSHVLAAIKGSSYLYEYGIQLVPNNEMADVFNMDKSLQQTVQIGDLIRIKRGDYKGDLAQVLEVDDSRGKVKVKMMPRLEKRGKLKGHQKYFNPEEYPTCTYKRHPDNPKQYMYQYKNMTFVDGMLIKVISLSSAITTGIQPTFDELKHFKDEIKPRNLQSKIQFNCNDRVFINSGEVRGLVGIIDNITDQTAFVWIPDLNLTAPLEFQISDLSKYFEQGDHVKIIQGRHKGKTGIIVSSEGLTAHILTDITKTLIQALFNNLIQTNDISTQDSISNEFVVGDIVTIKLSNNIGYVIQVDAEFLKVVLQTGEIQNIWFHDIAGKQKKRDLVGQDRDGNKLEIGDSVQIVIRQNQWYERKGIIKNAYRGWLFTLIVDQNQRQIVPVRSHHVTLLGADNEGELDYKQGELFQIKSGPYKGQTGKLVDILHNYVTLELTISLKKIRIDASAIEKVDSISNVLSVNKAQNEVNQTGMSPHVMTPAYKDASSPWFGTPIDDYYSQFRSPSVFHR